MYSTNTSGMKVSINLPAIIGYASIIFGAYAHDTFWLTAGTVICGISLVAEIVEKITKKE